MQRLQCGGQGGVKRLGRVLLSLLVFHLPKRNSSYDTTCSVMSSILKSFLDRSHLTLQVAKAFSKLRLGRVGQSGVESLRELLPAALLVLPL